MQSTFSSSEVPCFSLLAIKLRQSVWDQFKELSHSVLVTACSCSHTGVCMLKCKNLPPKGNIALSRDMTQPIKTLHSSVWQVEERYLYTVQHPLSQDCWTVHPALSGAGELQTRDDIKPAEEDAEQSFIFHKRSPMHTPPSLLPLTFAY